MVTLLIEKSGKKFLVKNSNQDFHCQFGFVKKDDLKKAKAGSVVTTNKGIDLHVMDASFMDVFQKIKRNAQIIPLKDVGLIISETGIDKKSKVVDAGAGSGALSSFLAHLVKEVVTYEIRDDFIEIVKHNKKLLGLTNLKIKKKDVYSGIDEKNVDLITLDVPSPWKALDGASSALKIGGFLVSYSPSIVQVADFVEAVKERKEFVYLKTSEISEREWEVDGRKVRPKSQGIGHSGFLSLIRRIQ